MTGSAPPLVIVMGVSGAGKTTIAQALSARLHWPFVDGDSLHPKANIDKMASGRPLDDADRAPWLAAICGWMDARARAEEPGVVSCSALKRAYRDTLRAGRPQARIVYLRGTQALIAERLARRKGHFMPPSLLASQFDDLQPPGPDENALTVEIDQPVDAVVGDIVRGLAL